MAIGSRPQRFVSPQNGRSASPLSCPQSSSTSYETVFSRLCGCSLVCVVVISPSALATVLVFSTLFFPSFAARQTSATSMHSTSRGYHAILASPSSSLPLSRSCLFGHAPVSAGGDLQYRELPAWGDDSPSRLRRSYPPTKCARWWWLYGSFGRGGRSYARQC